MACQSCYTNTEKHISARPAWTARPTALSNHSPVSPQPPGYHPKFAANRFRDAGDMACQSCYTLTDGTPPYYNMIIIWWRFWCWAHHFAEKIADLVLKRCNNRNDHYIEKYTPIRPEIFGRPDFFGPAERCRPEKSSCPENSVRKNKASPTRLALKLYRAVHLDMGNMEKICVMEHHWISYIFEVMCLKYYIPNYNIKWITIEK